MHLGLLTILFFIFYFLPSQAQSVLDTIKTEYIPAIQIIATKKEGDIQRLKPLEGSYLMSGKKNEVLIVSQKNIAFAEKYGRQIFSKVPGLFVYDMDGTGNQINIATRGLDPHRTWEFNIRKDGFITNSDMYGYPASHFNIPLEAIDRIEIVRGTGSLQYGAQFGGIVNYVAKAPDTTRKWSVESINSIGSYGLVSTHQSISGKINRVRYIGWINKKWITGYRDNSESNYSAQGLSLFYDIAPELTVNFQFNHSNYTTQLPGPLTDEMFSINPRLSTRARNYYNPNIMIPAISLDWKASNNTKLEIKTSSVLGARNSVLYDFPATVKDSINKSTMKYNNRQVDIDQFNSFSTELRIAHNYYLGSRKQTLVTGIQYMNNKMNRRQQGIGTEGSDFDLTLVNPVWGRDLTYHTQNTAAFIEHSFTLSNKVRINTGMRLEMGNTRMAGTISYYQTDSLPNLIRHHFPLFGLNAQFNVTRNSELYGGWSQAYRPVIFKDIIPTSKYEVADKNLKDARGYNFEIGYRGNQSGLIWDITFFELLYLHRLGTLVTNEPSGNLITRKTNIGNSRNRGIEFFLQKDFYPSPKSAISIFTASSWMSAYYESAKVRIGTENVDISGNRVESTPTLISRIGSTVKILNLSCSALWSFNSKSYADALNSNTPNISGSTGVVPSYSLFDISGSIQLNHQIKTAVNLNNVFNKQYFTKRPQFYPGPGIWPSDGRTFSIVFSIVI